METSINVLDLIAGSRRMAGFSLFQASPESVARALEALLGWAGEGRLRPAVDSVHPLERHADAFARLASRRAIGKVVLRL